MLSIIMDFNGFDAAVPVGIDIDDLIAAKSSKPRASMKSSTPATPTPAHGQRRAAGIPIDDNTWAEMKRMGTKAGMDAAAFDALAGWPARPPQ